MTDYLPGSIKHLNMLLGEQLTEGQGGGGSSWQTVFEGSVTTEESPRGATATLEGYSVSADTIKVTFNGTEYECNKQTSEGNVYYGDMELSEYPFMIAPFTEEGTNFVNIITETADTYTLKIEEPQSGGSSDFSTAEVTVTNNIDNNVTLYMPVIYDTTPMPSIDKAIYCTYSLTEGAPSETVRVALYGGTCLAQPASDIMGETFTVTGNAEYSNGMIIITGDCTITIS